jgi:hypothetical protein
LRLEKVGIDPTKTFFQTSGTLTVSGPAAPGVAPDFVASLE